MSTPTAKEKVDAYIQEQADVDLLRFITCGSVDDGKSTLIGRLLYEAQMIFDDQVQSLRADSKRQGTQGGEVDFALLVDGLVAEREQGITIDVAYRFFNTDKRKFIVADTPGHEQYTRNMVTGASTANLAIILIDATQGVLTQTRRHSFIVSLLGIKQIVLAVNKMDLVGYDKDVYADIVESYSKFATQLDFDSIEAIPLSALAGDNVLQRSTNTSWYSGPTLMGYLESVNVEEVSLEGALRFPVQWVNRPDASFRGYSGTIASGRVTKGDAVRVLPSGFVSTIEDIVLYKDQLETAATGRAVTLTLTDEIDISRGDVIVTSDQPCEVSDQFAVNMVWMDQDEGFIGRSYWLLLGAMRVSATVTDIKYKYNINTFEKLSSNSMSLNDIGEVSLSLDRPIPFEPFADCKAMGSFVLVDRYSNATVAAGMIKFSLRRAQNVHRQALVVDRRARESLNGHAGKVIWFTGLSGSGKSTVANALEQVLHQRGIRTYILDGDNVRHGLNKDLGFTDADRVENIRRIAEVSKLMVDAGIVVLTSFISPFRSERDMARGLFDANEFVEIYVNVPLEVAEDRDPKGLYKKARRGELPNFTGIDSDYEAPENPELDIDTALDTVEVCVTKILSYLDLEK
ncbi:MAG: sulfate adenylyltransferase subunit CysN [Pseudomonadales bacterium]|nr:sulfate adenylyltransferase subunit CysN [Pseudomonadales bacterium]